MYNAICEPGFTPGKHVTAELVVPVVDYEPAAFGGPPALPAVPATRPRCRAPRKPVPRDPSEETQARAAAAFADRALRRVLEVIDRRRPPAQVRPLLASGLAESLLPPASRYDSVARRGSAQLRRVRAQPVRPDGTAAEVTASYTRGDRVHAIACRVEQVAGGPHAGTPPRWQVVALHLG